MGWLKNGWIWGLLVLYPPCISGSENSMQVKTDSVKAVEFFRAAVEYGMKGEPEEALSLFEQSLHYRKKVYGAAHYRLGSTYLGMAVQYKNLHQLDNAYTYLKTAEEMYLTNAPANDSRLGDVYTNLGNYFRIKGNLEEAIRYHEKSLAIYEKSQGKTPLENFLSVKYNLADAYHQANREDEALRMVESIQEAGSFLNRIRVMNLMASIYASMGHSHKADSLYQEIINQLIANEGSGSYILADQYSSYAQFLNQESRQESSIVFLQKAEEIYLNYSTSIADLADLYRFMGDAFASKNITASAFGSFQSHKASNLSTAISWYEKALWLLTGEKGQNITRGNNFPVPTLRVLRDLGITYRQLAISRSEPGNGQKTKDLSKAMDYLMKGSDLVEFMRTGFITEESKIQFTTLQQDILQNATATAFDLYQLTGKTEWAELAFSNSERNKAASLFDQISEEKAQTLSLIPDSLQKLENILQTSLVYYREKLSDEQIREEPDETRIAEMKNRIFNLEEKFNSLIAYLEQNYRDYYEMKYDPGQVTFHGLQSKIRRNEIILSYTLLDSANVKKESLILFAISKHRIRAFQTDFTWRMKEEIGTLFRLLSDPGFMNMDLEAFSAYTRSSWSLYCTLIAPFKEEIKGKRITVIPDGIIHYLPFEALLTREVASRTIRFHDLPYLILDNPVHYIFSAALHRNHKELPFGKKNRALAFSPDYSTARTFRGDTLQLAELSGIREEVSFLADNIGTTWFDGAKATEKNFRQEAERYRIIHLATHTLINDSMPMLSRFAFYPDQSDSLGNDGWLTTSDIYTMDLSSRLTVLSGCHTGSGILKKGEGMISMARGFLYAGCPSVIMTLWEIEDRTGAGIITSFYKNLAHGKPKDVALQNAKVAHILAADPLSAHPHFWLGYILVGDPSPLFYSDEIYLFLAILVALSGVVTDLWLRRRKRNTRIAGEP